MTRAFAGVMGPVVTTFDEETGELAPAAFRENVQAHLASGLSGVVVCGSTGEAALLDAAERNALVELARPLVPGDRWLIAGTGAESTRACIRQCREAAERGSDAVLVVAPHYYADSMSAEALATHYRRVADDSPVPVLLYNIPKYMHFSLSPGLVLELAKHGNVVGIKDSSGDLQLLGSYMNAQSERFAVMTGSGSGVYAALEMGACGGILAVALFAGRQAVDLFQAFHAGDRATAGRAQERLSPLAKGIIARYGVPGVKAAMDRVELNGGRPRLPLLPLRERERRTVEELLATAGLAG